MAQEKKVILILTNRKGCRLEAVSQQCIHVKTQVYELKPPNVNLKPTCVSKSADGCGPAVISC